MDIDVILVAGLTIISIAISVVIAVFGIFTFFKQ